MPIDRATAVDQEPDSPIIEGMSARERNIRVAKIKEISKALLELHRELLTQNDGQHKGSFARLVQRYKSRRADLLDRLKEMHWEVSTASWTKRWYQNQQVIIAPYADSNVINYRLGMDFYFDLIDLARTIVDDEDVVYMMPSKALGYSKRKLHSYVNYQQWRVTTSKRFEELDFKSIALNNNSSSSSSSSNISTNKICKEFLHAHEKLQKYILNNINSENDSETPLIDDKLKELLLNAGWEIIIKTTYTNAENNEFNLISETEEDHERAEQTPEEYILIPPEKRYLNIDVVNYIYFNRSKDFHDEQTLIGYFSKRHNSMHSNNNSSSSIPSSPSSLSSTPSASASSHGSTLTSDQSTTTDDYELDDQYTHEMKGIVYSLRHKKHEVTFGTIYTLLKKLNWKCLYTNHHRKAAIFAPWAFEIDPQAIRQSMDVLSEKSKFVRFVDYFYESEVEKLLILKYIEHCGFQRDLRFLEFGRKEINEILNNPDPNINNIYHNNNHNNQNNAIMDEELSEVESFNKHNTRRAPTKSNNNNKNTSKNNNNRNKKSLSTTSSASSGDEGELVLRYRSPPRALRGAGDPARHLDRLVPPETAEKHLLDDDSILANDSPKNSSLGNPSIQNTPEVDDEEILMELAGFEDVEADAEEVEEEVEVYVPQVIIPVNDLNTRAEFYDVEIRALVMSSHQNNSNNQYNSKHNNSNNTFSRLAKLLSAKYRWRWEYRTKVNQQTFPLAPFILFNHNSRTEIYFQNTRGQQQLTLNEDFFVDVDGLLQYFTRNFTALGQHTNQSQVAEEVEVEEEVVSVERNRKSSKRDAVKSPSMRRREELISSNVESVYSAISSLNNSPVQQRITEEVQLPERSTVIPTGKNHHKNKKRKRTISMNEESQLNANTDVTALSSNLISSLDEHEQSLSASESVNNLLSLQQNISTTTAAAKSVKSSVRAVKESINESKSNGFLSWPVLTREREASQLLREISDCIRHGRGGIISISGAPGMGKTLTVRSVLRYLQQHAVTEISSASPASVISSNSSSSSKSARNKQNFIHCELFNAFFGNAATIVDCKHFEEQLCYAAGFEKLFREQRHRAMQLIHERLRTAAEPKQLSESLQRELAEMGITTSNNNNNSSSSSAGGDDESVISMNSFDSRKRKASQMTGHPLTIAVIEEYDLLDAQVRNYVTNLLTASREQGSSLLVIATGNIVTQMLEFSLATTVHSTSSTTSSTSEENHPRPMKIKLANIVFSPYTSNQLEEILKSKTRELISENSLRLLAKKIEQQQKGD